MGNKSLRTARAAKNDEFYTQLSTIEKEVIYYKEHFKGKTVYLNCDDPRESNFFKYFLKNFHEFKLKKLIASCYVDQSYNLFTAKDVRKPAVFASYDGWLIGRTIPKIGEIEITELKVDGDFRSDESIELLKEADIVVTNPPFSLFREFIAQMIEYDKQFLVLGNMNSISYKETFHLIKDGKLWPGVSFNKTIGFEVPEHYDTSNAMTENGKKLVKVPAIAWWTNMEYPRRKQDMILFRKCEGNEDKYPKYDNYDAINVDKVADIPLDYKGVIGVPITFIGQWNPEQFEVLGLGFDNISPELGIGSNFTNKKESFFLKRNPSFRKRVLCYTNYSGDLIVPYARVLIQNKDLNPDIYENKVDK